MPSSRMTMQEIAIELEQVTKLTPPYSQYKLRESANMNPPLAGNGPDGNGEEDNLDGSEKKPKKESKESKELFTQYTAVTKKPAPPPKPAKDKEPSLDGSAKKIKKKKGSNDLDTSGKKIRRKSAPSPSVNHKDGSIRENDGVTGQGTPGEGAQKRTVRRRKT